MKIAFRSRFLKDVKSIDDKRIKRKIDDLIDQTKSINKVDELSSLKKLKGYQNFYRIRIGNYRIGIVVDDETLIFSRALHRKEIYRYFP